MTALHSPAVCAGHGPTVHPDGTTTWRVWAPHAKSLELVLVTGERSEYLPMEELAQGWYERTLEASDDGMRYWFRLDGERERPDPASRWQPDGVHAPSALFRPEQFAWTDFSWSGVPLSDLVLYEIHVGTFTKQGTLDAIIPRLPELVDLGITALELMPLAQFPGCRGWGYDGTYPFAVQNSYGGPRALQRLVDAAHAHGLAVFLDVVYNHFGPEGNYLREFGDYFTENYRTPWGAALNYDDAGSDHVRQFVTDNVRYWLQEFHLDGLRLDAIHAIVDHSPVHILREIQRTAEQAAAETAREIHVIAESNLNDVRLLDPPSRGGFGLAGQWSDDFHHAVHTLLTGERDGYYLDFGEPEQLTKAINDVFVYDGCYSPYRRRRHGVPCGEHRRQRFVVSIQNHDQVGNRAYGDRFGSLLTAEQQRLAAALMLLAPTTPLLFMGEEYGEEHPFPFFCDFGDPDLVRAVRQGRRDEFADFAWHGEIPDPQGEQTFDSAILSWNWEAGTKQAGIRAWYRELLAIRRRELSAPDVASRLATWYGPGEGEGEREREREGILELIRTDDVFPGAPRLLAYFNLSSSSSPLPAHSLLIRDRITWHSLLSSELQRYGGRRGTGEFGADPRNLPELLPYEVLIFGLVEGDAS